MLSPLWLLSGAFLCGAVALAPALRELGVEVDQSQRRPNDNNRLITLRGKPKATRRQLDLDVMYAAGGVQFEARIGPLASLVTAELTVLTMLRGDLHTIGLLAMPRRNNVSPA
jgi:hypothetical protein